MWMLLAFIYAIGFMVTAMTVFRNRVFQQSYALNAGAVAFWPLYWGLFIASFLLGRTDKGPGSKRS